MLLAALSRPQPAAARKAPAKEPVVEATDPLEDKLDPLVEHDSVVRLRLVQGSVDCGWYADAQRLTISDQRDVDSTFVSAHRPGESCWPREWRFQRGSRDSWFQICVASSRFSQPEGWSLDVAWSPEDNRSKTSGFAVVQKPGKPSAEWVVEAEKPTGNALRTCRLRLVASETAAAIGWCLQLERGPEDERSENSAFLAIGADGEACRWLLEPVEEQSIQPSISSSVAEALAKSVPARKSAPAQLSGPSTRFYEVVVQNLCGRPLQLQGAKMPAMRKTVSGRVVKLLPEIALAGAPVALPRSVGPALAPPEPHSPATAIAKFESHATLDEMLEFSLTYLDSKGMGLTVRAHAHAASSVRSCAWTHGQDLDVVSVVEEVPRLLCRPPPGYAETALGVYAKPGRCAALQVGELQPEDEVLAGSGPREGRWLKISYPCDGWVQAETRDGRPLFQEYLQTRSNLRQVVTVRPAHGRSPRSVRLPEPDKAQQISATRPSSAQEEARKVEATYFNARAVEASRMLRESAILEGSGLKSCKPRQSVKGVF
mmetsp:Transcript_55047/g.98161  ORF Transcript_55047/g.98161 Transcript_55047/m.98161 type:complete len:543 (+) Transcript_55047:39-1667(+)